MKIGLDVQLLTGGNKTGIGWCADNIVRELAKDPEMQCELNFFSLFNINNKLDKYCSLRMRKSNCWYFSSKIFNRISRMLPIQYKWFFGKEQDIVQFFNYEVPAGVAGKTVTIVHDMAYKAYPDTVKKRIRVWLEQVLEQSCQRADAIITVSEFSKKELIRYLGISKDKITVMPNGVNFDIYHKNYSKREMELSQRKYNIEGEYFLYLGTLEPRKNLVRLVEAYFLLRKHFEVNVKIPRLVLAGGKGWYYDGIFDQVKKLGLEECVTFTGYVDEEDVAPVMRGAKAFVFPSLYEGFGMPPLEAMACGVPVIVSNVSSLPEVVGNAGLLVNPTSTQEICDAMYSLLNNESLWKELSEKGYERAQNFTWAHSVEILKEVYRKLEEDK